MARTCLAVLTLLASCWTAQATILDQQTSGINPNAPGYFGQFFSVPGVGTYTDVTFNFFSYPGTNTAYALGTGFLFSQPFGGAPADLSASDVGFLGSAEANNGVYDFGALSLNAGANYYFYENVPLPGGAISGQAAAEEFFYASSATNDFNTYQERSNNYQVTGTSAATPNAVTPEPPAFLLAGTGLLGIAGLLRRRFQHG